MNERNTIAHDTNSSRNSVARNVNKYKEEELSPSLPPEEPVVLALLVDDVPVDETEDGTVDEGASVVDIFKAQGVQLRSLLRGSHAH